MSQIFPPDPNAPRPFFPDGYKECPNPACGAHQQPSASRCTVCNCPFGAGKVQHMEPDEAFDAIKRGNEEHPWRERKQEERRRANERKLQATMDATEKARWQEESEREDPAFMAEIRIGLDSLLECAHYGGDHDATT